MNNLLTIVGIVTSLCCGSALAETSETVQEILGRTLESDNVKNAHIYADGTLDGVFNGISYAGNWSLDSGKFCRELTRGLLGERACLELAPVRDLTGALIAVDFQAPNSVTRFDLR